MKIFWGDLHAHCAVSYGKGTPTRALQVAREHLDFCSVTGHAFWPDMPMDLARYDHVISLHLAGFTKLKHYWNDLLAQLSDVNEPGEFVALPSYEWHSMAYGDHNCYFRDFDVSLIDGRDLNTLERNLTQARRDFMLVPHHCGYRRGFRGINWDTYQPARSPLIEVYSNHGAGEADDAYYEYHHSMGPRVGESMVREGLLAGHRFGFLASTDNHDGYPGHYGHGRVGVMASRLDADSIWQALKTGRTIASTGARIAVDAQLDTTSIGEVTQITDRLGLEVTVEGTAPIDKLEIIEATGRDWRVRRLPVPIVSPVFEPGRHKVKIEAGWGRGTQGTDWHIEARVYNGRLLACDPCFRNSDPQRAADVCDQILEVTDSGATWKCRSVPNPSGLLGGTHFNAGGPQAVVIDIDTTHSSRLRVSSGTIEFDLPIAELVRHSTGRQVGGIGSCALKIHRAVPEREFTAVYRERYVPLGAAKGFIYFRVSQIDGQIAWTSPIWLE